MIKDQEPLPPGTSPDVAAHVFRLRGINELAQLMIAWTEQTIESLLGGGGLPPPPAAPPVSKSTSKAAVPTSSVDSASLEERMSRLDAMYGDIPATATSDGVRS